MPPYLLPVNTVLIGFLLLLFLSTLYIIDVLAMTVHIKVCLLNPCLSDRFAKTDNPFTNLI